LKIERFEIRLVEIPMRMSVKHTLAERKTAINVLVGAHGEDGRVGWGESCPRPYVTGETVESVQTDLAETILPPLVGRSFGDLDETAAALIEQLDTLRRNQHAAFCTAELAVLDLVGKTFGVSAGDVLGPIVHDKVRYSGVVVSTEPAKIRKYTRLMRFFGVPEIKIKVGPSLEENLEILRVTRDVAGRRKPLRIDANAAWDGPETVRQLEAMAAYDLEGVEQPVPGEDIDGMVHATAAGLVPVAADESLCSTADAELLIERKGCDVFNLRVSKCGGLINCGRLWKMATDAGLRCQLGAQVGETGLLTAAGRHVATRCGDLLWREGSYGKWLMGDEIVTADLTIKCRGAAPALRGPGLGVELDPDKLEELTTATSRVE
jgi:muconate cycloisomerase